jgi:hypothetical protein
MLGWLRQMAEGEEGRNWERGGDYMIEMYSPEAAKKLILNFLFFFRPGPSSLAPLSTPHISQQLSFL